MHTPEDYLLDALEIVYTWDLPDDDIADAVNTQAHLISGCCPDYYYHGGNQAEYFCTTHR